MLNPEQPAGEPAGRPDAAPAAQTLSPGFYLVALPIGNLRDITLRALDSLAAADAIVCEDTRVTAKLLRHYGITKPMVAYHDHNAGQVRPRLIARATAGQALAVVTDAGLPGISDPGYKLVRAAWEAGCKVTVLPGPSAPVTALVSSGLPTDRFLFAGFLPQKAQARAAAWADLARVPATVVVFESTRRLPASLADLAAIDPDRPVAVARELTKLHEEIRRGSAAILAAAYAHEGPPKGEVTLVVGPPAKAATSAEDLDAALEAALASATLRDATDQVVAETGLPRRVVYQRALALSRDRDP